ncbi:MAG: methyltransferase domain-containing protein [Candidatus Omnitrophica bacterium]|nr:methyltransferase domain-containing protein [Candidatus Omnitrophota bacterium]
MKTGSVKSLTILEAKDFKRSAFFKNSLINNSVTVFISLVGAWRFFSLRLRNKIKSCLKKQGCQLSNNDTVGKAFLNFKVQGYQKLNIGGGRKNLKGFVNIDFISYPGVERQIQANILDLKFIPDGSVSHVHSNHLVEHLTAQEFREQLAQYYRILETGGLLTLRCPNILGVCYGFWFEVVPEVKKERFLSLGFPEDEDFYNPQDGWYHKNFYGFLHWVYGDVGNIANQHLNIFTPSVMRAAVQTAGFDVVEMSDPESSNLIVLARKG